MKGEKGLQQGDGQVNKEAEMMWESSKGSVVAGGGGGGGQSRESIPFWSFLPLGLGRKLCPAQKSVGLRCQATLKI